VVRPTPLSAITISNSLVAFEVVRIFKLATTFNSSTFSGEISFAAVSKTQSAPKLGLSTT
jgi:hypothetical protein